MASLSDAFVASTNGRWFIVVNEDHCDEEGNYGLSSVIIGDYRGYESYHDGMAALHKLREG